VEPGTGRDVVVEVTRGGRDAAQLTIERGSVGNYEALRVIFPSDEIVYPRMARGSNSNFQIREDGTFGQNWDRGRGRRGGRSWGRQVSIRGSGPGLEAYADLKVSVPEGADFALFSGVGKTMISNVNGQITVDASSAPVTAQGVKGSLSVDIGSGSVTVTNAEAELSIETGSGDVQVTGVRGNNLSIETGSGQIVASDLTVDLATVETGSGSLTLSGVRGATLHFETGSGNIDAELVTDVADLSVETGSGDVILRVPENLGAMVDFDTGSGRIEAEVPLEVRRWAKDHVTGKMGDGQGRLSVETGSGDVRLVRLVSAGTPQNR
jgi:lia operon protein LiaG